MLFSSKEFWIPAFAGMTEARRLSNYLKTGANTHSVIPAEAGIQWPTFKSSGF